MPSPGRETHERKKIQPAPSPTGAHPPVPPVSPPRHRAAPARQSRPKRKHATRHQEGRRSDWAGPLPHKRQAEPGTQAGNAQRHGPHARALQAPCELRVQRRQGGQGNKHRRRASAPTHNRQGTPSRRQPDQARGTHRAPAMAYQQARKRNTWMGQPTTRTARGARGGWQGGGHGETGNGTTPPPVTCSERRAQTRKALLLQKQ